jgi:ketosteroid isomerase-like protein
MTKAEILKTLDNFVDGFHKCDLERVIAMFAENGTAEHWTMDKLEGRRAIREQMQHFFNPEAGTIHWDIVRVDIDEATNVAWSIWIMTVTKDGQSSQMHGCDTFEFDKQGLIARNAVYVKTNQPLVTLK